MATKEDSILVNAEQAAKLFSLNPWSIRRLAYRGLITPYRYGTSVRFSPEEILSLMKSEGERQPVIHRARKKGGRAS